VLRDRESDIVILEGRCSERESVPYKALDSLIDHLSLYLRKLPRAQADALLPRDSGALARLFPVLRRVDALVELRQRPDQAIDAQELRRRGCAALRDLLARLVDRHPVVIVIDDLQWTDADSAALIADMIFEDQAPPLLFIGVIDREGRPTRRWRAAVGRRCGAARGRCMVLENHVGDEGGAVRVGPLQIVDDDHDGVTVDEARQQIAKRGAAAASELLRVDRLIRPLPQLDQGVDPAQHRKQRASAPLSRGSKRVRLRSWQLPEVQAQVVDEAVERLVRTDSRSEQRPSRITMSDSRSRSTPRKRRTNAVLPIPEAPCKEHRLRAAKHRHLEGAVQHRNLRLTADERRALGAGRGVLAPRRPRLARSAGGR